MPTCFVLTPSWCPGVGVQAGHGTFDQRQPSPWSSESGVLPRGLLGEQRADSLAGLAVDELSCDVKLTDVPRVLLEQMEQDPSE